MPTYIQVSTTHPVDIIPPPGEVFTVKNVGSVTIYYKETAVGESVSPTSDDGEIAAGGELLVTRPTWVISKLEGAQLECRNQRPNFPTKTVTQSMGSHGSVEGTEGAGQFVWRMPIVLPVTTLRWRLKLRNYNSAAGGETAGVAATMNNAYKGTPKWNTGRWKGAFTSAPTKVLGTTTIGGASDSTSAWVEDSTQQFTAYVPQALSLGITKPAGKWFFDEMGGPLWSNAAASAKAGETGEPSGVGSIFNYSAYDVRLEYEYAPAAGGLVGLVIGDSIASGHELTEGGAYPGYETWPAVAGLRAGHPIVWTGPPGCGSGDFTSLTSFRFTRLNLTTTVPNYAIIALGVNNLGMALATYESNITALVAKVQEELKIPTVYLATSIPIKAGEAAETRRVELNTFLRTMPAGVQGVIDLDKQLAKQATPSEIDAAWGVNSEANPHVNRAAYQRMAGALILP